MATADSIAGSSPHPTDYKGFTYQQEIIEDEDTRKILHVAMKLGSTNGQKPPTSQWGKGDGENSFIFDWSPYSVPGQKDWELWIDLGMPDRLESANGPHNTSSLIIIANHIREFDLATQRDYKG